MIVDSVDETIPAAEPVQSVNEDNFGPEDGWEFEFAAKHDILYPTLKTVTDLLPLGWALTPSGRRQFSEASLGGKALILGLDALVLLPAGILGKGLKISAKTLTAPIRSGIKRLPFATKSVATESKSVIEGLMRQIDNFVPMDVRSGLVSKYKITNTSELDAIIAGKNIVEESVGRSGFLETVKPSEEFKALFNKKGQLNANVSKDISKWSLPIEEQRLTWQKKTWKNLAGSVLNNPKYTLEDVFENQTRRVFGLDRETMALWATGSEDMDLLIKDALLNEGKILRGIDVKSWHYFAPVRKIFGGFEEKYGAKSAVYDKAVKISANTNIASNLYLSKFHAMLANRGLGEVSKVGTFKHFFRPAEWKAAGEIVVKLDAAQSRGVPTAALQEILNTGNARTQQIVKTWQEFTDYLYADYMKVKIPQIVEKLDLTEYGKLMFDKIWSAKTGKKNLSSYITETLAEGNNLNYETKYTIIQNLLKYTRGILEKNPTWLRSFDVEAQALTKEGSAKLTRVMKELNIRTQGSNVGLPDYLQNYATRIFKEPPKLRGRAATHTPEELTASFVKSRTVTETEEELVTDLEKIVSIRLRGQAKDLYMYPEYGEIIRYSKEFFPPNLKAYTEHYMDRLLGRASPVDQKLADNINATFGTNWNADRIMQLSYSINDLIYMGGIGFKPFSAMRNYFQPLITVPADLGGTKDILWLAKGYKRATAPEFRKYMQDIGAITDYAPDLLFKPTVIPFNKSVSVFGKEIGIPSQQKMRDLGMWLFKKSDQHNRYVAGGAALEKWNYYLSKFARKDSSGTTVLGGKALEDFKKKLNLESREKWVRADIEKLLSTRRGDALEEAKALWVKDVVADTQFLYGSVDSPLINQVGGGITRTAAVFQSWWMNYGSLLSKWITRSGDVDKSASRMFGWMLSSAVGYSVMQTLWGGASARRAVFTGPLPLEPSLPPSWRPFVEGLKLAVAAGEVPLGISDMDTVKSRMMSTINSSLIFVPGGLQLKKSVPPLVEGDMQELIKSILQLRSK